MRPKLHKFSLSSKWLNSNIINNIINFLYSPSKIKFFIKNPKYLRHSKKFNLCSIPSKNIRVLNLNKDYDLGHIKFLNNDLNIVHHHHLLPLLLLSFPSNIELPNNTTCLKFHSKIIKKFNLNKNFRKFKNSNRNLNTNKRK